MMMPCFSASIKYNIAWWFFFMWGYHPFFFCLPLLCVRMMDATVTTIIGIGIVPTNHHHHLMFGLLGAAWKQFQGQQPITTTILLGPSGVGKTTILERLKTLFACNENETKMTKIRPTVGLNVANLKVENTYFLVWDFGGKESLRPIWEKYVGDAKTVVYVIDSSSEDTVNEAKKLLKELLERQDLLRVPFLIYVNKQDLPGALSLQQVVDKLDLAVEVNRLRWFQNCSALQNYGIKEGFEWLERHLTITCQNSTNEKKVNLAKPESSYRAEQ